MTIYTGMAENIRYRRGNLGSLKQWRGGVIGDAIRKWMDQERSRHAAQSQAERKDGNGAAVICHYSFHVLLDLQDTAGIPGFSALEGPGRNPPALLYSDLIRPNTSYPPRSNGGSDSLGYLLA